MVDVSMFLKRHVLEHPAICPSEWHATTARRVIRSPEENFERSG
jgi:hypothetical protein